jgi:hypothetical protein
MERLLAFRTAHKHHPFANRRWADPSRHALAIELDASCLVATEHLAESETELAFNVGKGKVEVDVANGVPELTDATLDENGCTPMYLDICYSTGKAPAQEMVAQLSQCPAENGDEGSESVVGGYQLIRSRNKLNGWGQVTGTMQLTGSSGTMKLTLSGILEH